jgi:hypothetical protein
MIYGTKIMKIVAVIEKLCNFPDISTWICQWKQLTLEVQIFLLCAFLKYFSTANVTLHVLESNGSTNGN